jgi:hypothetical protein
MDDKPGRYRAELGKRLVVQVAGIVELPERTKEETATRIVNLVLESAYQIAQGQSYVDRFRSLGTSQLYWRGRSNAAMEIREMKRPGGAHG